MYTYVCVSIPALPAVKSEVYTNLASAAESGMDFSSRWLQDGRYLSSIRTVDILPVDLNAILCSNEATLARLHSIAGTVGRRLLAVCPSREMDSGCKNKDGGQEREKEAL